MNNPIAVFFVIIVAEVTNHFVRRYLAQKWPIQPPQFKAEDAALIAAALARYRATAESQVPSGIHLPGWHCPRCGAFNGEEKEKRKVCRSCQWPKDDSLSSLCVCGHAKRFHVDTHGKCVKLEPACQCACFYPSAKVGHNG